MAARPQGVDRAPRVRLAGTTHYKALVILLQFSDHPADTLNHKPSDYADLLFSVGTRPTGSLRDYYREVSRGAFDISGVVTTWYTAPRTYAEYTSGAGGFGAPPGNARQMAFDALALADPDVDLSQFDSDGPDGLPDSGDDDGMVDALFIVHAGPGGEETADQDDIWSHQWDVRTPYNSPDGVSAFLYTTEPEEFAGNVPYTTPGELISIGVFCHEFGHILGLPDLYDTSNTFNANEGLGEWELMASGLYNHRLGETLGSTPSHLSAWSLARLGWVTPIWVTQDSLGLTIPPVETSNTILRLWSNGAEDAEYFLVENRQPIGFDAALVRSAIEGATGPAHGLLIYHVDESVVDQSNPDQKLVDLEEGGGTRIPTGFIGEQNLDLATGQIASQPICGGSPNVVGNRGDRYDPWPGEGNRTSFDGFSCPNSNRKCKDLATQVAVRDIAEVAGNITADILVTELQIRREPVVIDDAPSPGTPNNGNALLESGEIVRMRFPITNLGTTTTVPLSVLLAPADEFLILLPDTLEYPPLTPGETDSGSVFTAEVSLTPDPGATTMRYQIQSPFNLVTSDSFQLYLGTRTGLCDNFEGGVTRWRAVANGCDGVNEWHPEQGPNSTGFGSWAWRLGPYGPIGSYASTQDARLMSPPIRLPGTTDTLRFFHRYDCEFAFDGLSVEISTDAGTSWNLLTPVGGYTSGDRYSGTKSTFTEAIFPLDGYSGVVQIGFRFRSQPPNDGIGWWIDDVTVTGDAPCAPVDVAIERFTAAAVEDVSPPRVQLEWAIPATTSVTLTIERSSAGIPPGTIIRLPDFSGQGSAEDVNVVPGVQYDYWLRAARPGHPDAVAGPIRVSVPAPAPGAAPKVFALSRVHPNPFRPAANLAVSLDRDGPFMVRIYRPDGGVVRTLRFPARPAGTHAITWDGRDDRGRSAAAGIYFFELRFGERTRVQKAVLLR
ncbi:MAG TPA: M6 family metalloprotease domain-containing protein [Candidatus Eisenbacteria bacterium]|nr:M6 family metalloprotease domain-containing protein [Candidatus Eisenbacteria bacterium]